MEDWIGVTVLLCVVGLVLYATSRIRYTIDDQYVRVMLGGATVRKIALADIEDVDTRPIWWWNEHWANTLWPAGRIVRIRRRSGLCRNFVITPQDREAFVRELRTKLNLSHPPIQ